MLIDCIPNGLYMTKNIDDEKRLEKQKKMSNMQPSFITGRFCGLYHSPIGEYDSFLRVTWVGSIL